MVISRFLLVFRKMIDLYIRLGGRSSKVRYVSILYTQYDSLFKQVLFLTMATVDENTKHGRDDGGQPRGLI
jgi:hypothetical protein